MSSPIATPALAGTPPASTPQSKKRSWLRYEHKDYAALKAKWQLTLDAYTGEVLDSDKVTAYLIKKAQAETDPGYKERCGLADYTNHFATVVDSLAGMLFAVEGDAARSWGDDKQVGLGDEHDKDTPAGQLWKDADGQGASWTSTWKATALDLLLLQRCWILVDSLDGDPVVKIIPTMAVKNWRYRNGVCVQAVICESVDVRTDLRQEPVPEEQYCEYTVGGWQRWKIVTDSNGDETEIKLTGPGSSGTFRYVDPRKRPALPLFLVQLPLRRMIGWVLAKKAIAIFNKESERDHLLRAAQLAIKLMLSADDTLIEALKVSLAAGDNALQESPGQGAHHYESPSAEPAAIANATLAQKRDEFYVTGFQAYNDSAQARTATEVRQDTAAGVGAILQLLKGAVDEAENQALWRIEQTLWSLSPDRWFVAKVDRSDNFALEQPNEIVKRIKERYWPDEMPLGRTGMIAAAKIAAELEGLPADDQEMGRAVDAKLAELNLDTMQKLPVDAETITALTMRWIEATGVLDLDGQVDTAAGTKRLKRELVETRVRAIAEAEEERRINGSPFDVFGAGGGTGDPTKEKPPTPPTDPTPPPGNPGSTNPEE